MIGRFLLPTAIVLSIFVYMHGGGSKSVSASVTQECGASPGTVNVTIDWPAPAVAPDETWVDVGISPAFGAGTFHGNGPISPPATTARVDALPRGLTLYYRVNSRVQGTWHVQASGSFTTDCAHAVPATPTPAVDIIRSG